MSDHLFLWSCILILPIIMIFVMGIFWKYRPPKYVESGIAFYGYRTNRSLKSKEAWYYAHQQVNIIWIRGGIISIVITVIGRLLLSTLSLEWFSLLSIAISFIIWIRCLIKIEKKLKRDLISTKNRV